MPLTEEQIAALPDHTQVHNDLICDGCGQTPIYGPARLCNTCDEFVFCKACHEVNPEVDSHVKSHTFKNHVNNFAPLMGEVRAAPRKKAEAEAAAALKLQAAAEAAKRKQEEDAVAAKKEEARMKKHKEEREHAESQRLLCHTATTDKTMPYEFIQILAPIDDKTCMTAATILVSRILKYGGMKIESTEYLQKGGEHKTVTWTFTDAGGQEFDRNARERMDVSFAQATKDGVTVYAA